MIPEIKNYAGYAINKFPLSSLAKTGEEDHDRFLDHLLSCGLTEEYLGDLYIHLVIGCTIAGKNDKMIRVYDTTLSHLEMSEELDYEVEMYQYHGYNIGKGIKRIDFPQSSKGYYRMLIDSFILNAFPYNKEAMLEFYNKELLPLFSNDGDKNEG